MKCLFSGIIEDIGTVFELVDTPGGRRLKIGSPICADLKIGDSVSVNGVCLTAVEVTKETFSADAILETLRRTNLGNLKVGGKVNLERAMKLSDRIGGHLVSGHIDALAEVDSILPEGSSKVFTFRLPSHWAPYFVEKGSVAIDGVSLTVVDCDSMDMTQAKSFRFRVALIPHTLKVTVLGQLALGDSVNIETDVIARYAARWMAPSIGRQLFSEALAQCEN